MQDWESYSKTSSLRDDPWDVKKPHKKWSNQSVEGAHDPSPNHAIGSCEDKSAPSRGIIRAGSNRKHSSIRRVVILLVPILLISLFAQAVSVLVERAQEVTSSVSTDDNVAYEDGIFSDDDGFSKNIDPDEEDDAAEEDENEPSKIALYSGSTDFTLSLVSSEGKDELSYQEIYALVEPSVVTIAVYGETSGAYATGIVLTEDGYILTNQHVVAGESYAWVTTTDDITYEALLVGEDASTDLAVLKIDASGLTPAEFGDSSELLVGDECFAIGNPLGVSYRNTFTNGIVSAINRTVTMNDYTMSLIQTTAALNSGNSGGPLINCYGQVIGINNMKIMSTSTTVEGLGFAIPSATAKRIVNSLLTDGVVDHPVIGISCYTVSIETDSGETYTGIYVASIDEKSDALTQGLMIGDLIIALNGNSVTRVSDVDLSDYHVGDTVTVTVYRDGLLIDITFALVESDDLG